MDWTSTLPFSAQPDWCVAGCLDVGNRRIDRGIGLVLFDATTQKIVKAVKAAA
jgi:hypothetical protein